MNLKTPTKIYVCDVLFYNFVLAAWADVVEHFFVTGCKIFL